MQDLFHQVELRDRRCLWTCDKETVPFLKIASFSHFGLYLANSVDVMGLRCANDFRVITKVALRNNAFFLITVAPLEGLQLAQDNILCRR